MQSFNVAGQGPFPVMIEDISSRNDLLPMSNILLLSVTDLLQREDCCCYKREDLLKKRSNFLMHNQIKRTSSKSFKRSQLLVVKILRAIQVQVQESLTPSFQSYSSCSFQRLSSSEALSLSTLTSVSHLREQSSNCLLCYISLFSLSSCTLFLFPWAHQFRSISFFLFYCSFIGTQAQSLLRDWVGEGNT